jgi:hypothetical protein
MRLHKLLIAMTAANLVLLAWRVAQLGAAQAQGPLTTSDGRRQLVKP